MGLMHRGASATASMAKSLNSEKSGASLGVLGLLFAASFGERIRSRALGLKMLSCLFLGVMKKRPSWSSC